SPCVMADIRLVRPKGGRLWPWVGAFATLGFLLWASALVVGDATDPEEQPRVGAQIGFGNERPPIIPARATPFSEIGMLQPRDLGRLVDLDAVVLSPVVASAVWTRAAGGRYILVRFEPAPPEGALRAIRPGTALNVNGYLAKISEAEFAVW